MMCVCLFRLQGGLVAVYMMCVCWFRLQGGLVAVYMMCVCLFRLLGIVYLGLLRELEHQVLHEFHHIEPLL